MLCRDNSKSSTVVQILNDEESEWKTQWCSERGRNFGGENRLKASQSEDAKAFVNTVSFSGRDGKLDCFIFQFSN